MSLNTNFTVKVVGEQDGLSEANHSGPQNYDWKTGY